MSTFSVENDKNFVNFTHVPTDAKRVFVKEC